MECLTLSSLNTKLKKSMSLDNALIFVFQCFDLDIFLFLLCNIT